MRARKLGWPLVGLFALMTPVVSLSHVTGAPGELAVAGAVSGALGVTVLTLLYTVYSKGEPWGSALRLLPWRIAYGVALGAAYAVVR